MIRWLIALLMGAVVAYVAYGRSGTVAGARTVLLAVLRAAAVALVAALLLGAPAGRSQATRAVVAVDASASWLRAAPGDTDLLRNAIAPALREAGADSILLAGDSLRAMTASSARTFTPGDLASSVRPALDRAAALGRPLVLVTDGEIDDQTVQADMPAGSRVIVPARVAKSDAAVGNFESPPSATGGDTVQVTIVIVAGGAGSSKGLVKLVLDSQTLSSVALAPLTAFASRRIAVTGMLPKGAKRSILHAVVVTDGDAETRNDTLSATLEIGDKPAAVFVSTAPDLDVREALGVLRGALDVPARAYLRIAPGVWREEGSLKSVTEADVRARTLDAGMVILHGDTSWGNISAQTRGAHAFWVPAAATALARAGETQKTAEWYVTSAPPSPLAGALAGLPWDTLPPIAVSAPAKGMFSVIDARLGKSGAQLSVVSGRESAGLRTLVITGSGFAGWSLRGGRSADAFVALWGAMFDWLSAARGDLRAARPVAGIVRAGDAVRWRRGGADSVVAAAVTLRGGKKDSLQLRFANGGSETTSPSMAPGVYDVQTTGGSSLLVVNATRELVPRAPSLRTAGASTTALQSAGMAVSDVGWVFALALLLLCGEWLLRRYAGLR